ncbi:hypothetical protein K2173_023694 [Erythroxylum novogranatense]|uniref:Pentatricopeptide repeat-containing protein n=1 Tax=Erythroxylum novogranatense TaxID=1862640 RepID=A0AAV8TPC3_9ROSI|nr:hypothetical protein K2173_023694 [Erythroxylum novogranatense]
MSVQNFLKTLKTVKVTPSSSLFTKTCQKLIKPTSKSTKSFPSGSAIYTLNSTKFYQILSDPDYSLEKCLHLFNFVLENQSLISFKPDLQARITVIGRLFKARWFSPAEDILKSVVRYPFPLLASTIEKCCCLEAEVVEKLFNMMLKVYSDQSKLDLVSDTFDHMKDNGFKIDERNCSLHLLWLKRNDQMELGLEFFNKMMESGMDSFVYSLPALVHGLCESGQIERCRLLLEEIVSKGINPTITSYNILINACAKRWNFKEIDSILTLMKRQVEEFDIETYRILVDGYLSFGKTEEAEKLVLEMHEKNFKADTHMYNLIINGYFRQSLTDKALLVFDRMNVRGFNPNADTYWALMNGLCKLGKMEIAMLYVGKMQSEGIELDQASFYLLMDGFCSKGMAWEAFELHVEMERRGFDSDVSLCNKIASGLCKSKQFEAAKMLMNTMVKRGGLPEMFSLRNLIGL